MVTEIQDIAENFASYTTENAPHLDTEDNLRYYFAGSIATMLTCNAVSIEDTASEKEKISVNDEDRKFLQKYFPRQTGDIDVITIKENDTMYRLASKKGSLSSRSIMESVPNAGEFCKQLSGNFYGYCWDDLSDEHQITHKISKITTERGNSFYVTRPDYQLANKICEVAILDFEDNEKNQKNIRDISIMFSVFSKMYSNEELLDALSVCLKDREENKDIAQGQSAKACFRKIAPKMKKYLTENIPSSEKHIERIQNMLNYIEKPINKTVGQKTFLTIVR